MFTIATKTEIGVQACVRMVAIGVATFRLTALGLAQNRPDIVWMQGGHGWASLSLAFSPDGHYLVSSGDDGTIKLWRFREGIVVRTLREVASCVVFSPDGQYLAGGGSGEVKIWRSSDGSLVRTISAHSGSILQIAFSPNGEYLASLGGDGTAKLWRVSDGSLVHFPP